MIVVTRDAAKIQGVGIQQSAVMPVGVVEAARRRSSLLSVLLATQAGYFAKWEGDSRRCPEGNSRTILIYCVKGEGWCELAGQRHRVTAGDLLVLPPGTPGAYGAKPSDPWTIHWVHAMGKSIPDYLAELCVTPRKPLVRVGEDLPLALLFNEVFQGLTRGFTFPSLLRASHALAHLLAVAIELRHQHREAPASGFQKIGRCIEYMSGHLDQSLKVKALAAMASLSPAHFAVVFREQTGSSPRDYLHLLRMHRACEWLTSTSTSLKEIADRLGYQDQFHFSRRFKAFSGVAPSNYRFAQRPLRS
jgi:AraC-like DNA-binding protein